MTQTNLIIQETNSLLQELVTTHGREIFSRDGSRRTSDGFYEPTNNLHLRVYAVDGEVEVRYLLLVRDNASLNQLELIEISNEHSDASIQEAVTASLLDWEPEWIESFRSENLLD